MHEVEVDVIHIQPGALLVEDAAEVVEFLHLPDRRLRGDVDLLPVAILKGLAHHPLAVAAVVGIGRVDIVHAPIDRMANDLDRGRLIDVGLLSPRW